MGSGFYWGSAGGHTHLHDTEVCDCAMEENVTLGLEKRGVCAEVDYASPLAVCHETGEGTRKESASASLLAGASANGTSIVGEANAGAVEGESAKGSDHPAEASGDDARVVCGSGKGSESCVHCRERSSAVCGEAGNEVVGIGK